MKEIDGLKNSLEEVMVVKKYQDKMEKLINSMMELIRKNPVKTQFVEEEIIVDVNMVDGMGVDHILIDSGAPVSLVSAS